VIKGVTPEDDMIWKLARAKREGGMKHRREARAGSLL